jgi:hypothetical protein
MVLTALLQSSALSLPNLDGWCLVASQTTRRTLQNTHGG